MRSRRLIAGRYRLEEQLGSGGMGVVWRATDEELHRVVAVKRALSAEGAHEPQRAKLLKREAMAVAKVNHPNVVTLFDVVTTGDELWLVMEYLPARNLADQGLRREHVRGVHRAPRVHERQRASTHRGLAGRHARVAAARPVVQACQ